MIKSVIKSRKFYILLLVILIGGYFYFRSVRVQNAKTEIKLNPQKDTLVYPKIQDIKQDLTLAGSIDASAKANVRFQSSGLMTWVGVKEGDKVKKWQSLASLDKRDLKKQLEKEFNTYRSQLSTFDSSQYTYQENKDRLTLTDEMKRILSRSQNSLNNAVIDYELADLAIKYSTIYSPIDGIVVHLDQPLANVNITPATATFDIIDPQSVYLKSEIDQEDVGKVTLGQKTSIKLDSFPDQSYDSQITYVSFTPVQGQTSTVYEIRFNLPIDNTSLQYRLGMDGDAVITLKQATRVLTVPQEAIYEDAKSKYVLVKQANEVVKKPVKTGIESDTDVEILEGLLESDQIVIRKTS